MLSGDSSPSPECDAAARDSEDALNSKLKITASGCLESQPVQCRLDPQDWDWLNKD